MTRKEHLAFCKRCANRKVSLETGLLCNITGEIANFEKECSSFLVDERIIERENEQKLAQQQIEKIQSEQSLTRAIWSGLIIGVIGAFIWGLITVALNMQIGIMGIALGALVGITIRFFGKGMNPSFGIAGAIIAVASCFLGNFFSIIGYISNYENLGFLETILLFDYTQLIPVMTESFGLMDILFYLIAASAGFKYSFRQYSE